MAVQEDTQIPVADTPFLLEIAAYYQQLIYVLLFFL